MGLLFYIPARAHRHKGRKLRFQEAQRRRHTGSSSCCSYCCCTPRLHIKSLYPLHLHIKSLFVFDLPAVLSLKNRPNHHALRFSHFSHNTLFVGLLFYIPARAHRHKGRKLRFQEAQRRRHTGNYNYSCSCCNPPFTY